MAELPKPLSHTALAIDAAHEGRARAGDSAGLPMSAVGDECDRALWMAFRWAGEPERPTGARERRFRTGNQYERWLLDDLRAIGCEVYEVDEATGKQFAVNLCDGHLRGKIDGVAVGLPEAPRTAHLVECKSHKDRTYKEVVKKGLKEGKPDHYAQVQLYMKSEGLTRCLYMAANKNTDEVHCERVAYDPVFCEALVARIDRITRMDRPPVRLHEDPAAKAAFACQWCKARSVCHEGAFARVNCRTCIDSTPVSEGRWYCEMHGKYLSYSDQQKGCSDHKFIPDLVPGEQVDADDEKGIIIYKMSDGSTWTDGENHGQST